MSGRLYVAIGDSLTVGYGADSGAGFVPRFQAKLAELYGEQVECVNAGVNGVVAGDILRRIKADKAIRAHMRRADVITVTAGGNNLIQAAQQYAEDKNPFHLVAALRRFRQDYKMLLAELHAVIRRGKNAAVICVGIYNPFPKEKDAIFWVKRFAKQIRTLSTAHEFLYAELFQAFAGQEKKLLYSDQIHPNAEGYRAIADKVAWSFRVNQ